MAGSGTDDEGVDDESLEADDGGDDDVVFPAVAPHKRSTKKPLREQNFILIKVSLIDL